LTNSIIINSHYLPSISVFAACVKFNKILIEYFENYQKQTLRNRCYILTANGIQMLTIPVHKQKTYIKDIKIDYSQNWKQIHLRALQTAYGKGAYFEFFFPYFEKIYQQNLSYLVDFNTQLMTLCFNLMKLKKNIFFTEKYQKEYSGTVLDCRNIFEQSIYLPTQFENAPHRYFQLFGNKFVSNLSVVDLLFNLGTNSIDYLYKYSINKE
jgi:hypothetical protein